MPFLIEEAPWLGLNGSRAAAKPLTFGQESRTCLKQVCFVQRSVIINGNFKHESAIDRTVRVEASHACRPLSSFPPVKR